MNYQLLYQWETLLAAYLPCLNGWQSANVALFSYGIIKAESCQPEGMARQVNCGEAVAVISGQRPIAVGNILYAKEWLGDPRLGSRPGNVVSG